MLSRLADPLFLLALAASVLTATPSAHAQPYPSRFLRLVVPFPAGGTSEILARVLAKKMSDSMGQNIVIENIAGATGVVGVGNVARAAPDGYTLLFGYSSQFVIAPLLSANLPYDPIKSFQPIGSIGQFRLLITAHAKLPINTLADLTSYAKQNPRKLSYGSAGVGANSHLILEQYKLLNGLDIVHVPYRGGGPAIIDLIAGRLDVYADAPGALVPRINEGTLKPLAVTSVQRLSYLPDVPSAGELGMPELNAASWTALFAPAGTPPHIVKVLETELGKALIDGELQTILAQNYYEVIPATPAQVITRIQTETERWRKVVEATGIKLQ